MKQFWLLTKWEYIKLLRRKIVWITLGIMSVLCVFSSVGGLFGSYYIEGERVMSHWEMLKQDQKAAGKYEGRKIDQSLLDDLNQAASEDESSVPTDLETLVMNITRDDSFDISEEKLYQTRKDKMESLWTELFLTEGEKEYLRDLNERLEIPLTYHYSQGYQNMTELMYTMAFMQVLLIAVCVPAIFSDEHTRRMAPLLQASRFGKGLLYGAKIFAGLSFSLVGTVFLCLLQAVPTFCIYGVEGFGASIQLQDTNASWLLTIGQVVLILFGICLVLSLFHGMCAMLLGDLARNSLIPMAVMTGFLLFSALFNVPQQYRILSQIWDCIPANLQAYWGAFGNYMIPVAGHYLKTWQAVPVIYLMVTIVLFVIGRRIYCRYQVTKGR